MDLTYSLIIPEMNVSLLDQSLENEGQVKIARKLIDTDGPVTIDFSDLTTIKVLYVKTNGKVTLTINTEAVLVEDLVFMTLQDLTSLSIETSETTAINIEVSVFGD